MSTVSGAAAGNSSSSQFSGRNGAVNDNNKTQASIFGLQTTSEHLASIPTTQERLLNQESGYTVKAGDTLSKIAQQYGVSINQLVTANNIANPDRIDVGQHLSIPESGTTTYQIKSGDNLSVIAARFDVSVNDLVGANNIQNPDRIYPGDTLTIPMAPQAVSSAAIAPPPVLGTPLTPVENGVVGNSTIQSLVAAVPSGFRRNPDVATHVERITNMAQKHGLTSDQTAYVLATATHESGMGSFMEEFASGRAYEGRLDLGNAQTGDGVRFKGRGYVQITGRANYQDWSNRLGIDLVGNPQSAEQPEIAAEILVVGMKEGSFTGRALDQYVNNGTTDFTNARRVVNGTDKADLIAGYALDFQQALQAVPINNSVLN